MNIRSALTEPRQESTMGLMHDGQAPRPPLGSRKRIPSTALPSSIMSESQQPNVPHLENVSASDRKKIKNVGGMRR